MDGVYTVLTNINGNTHAITYENELTVSARGTFFFRGLWGVSSSLPLLP